VAALVVGGGSAVFSDAILARAAALVARCRAQGVTIALAESCTGGLVCGLLTEIPGSSAVLERGFVVYSNQAKQELLGVSALTLAQFGAVSAETAREMALGALAHSSADVAASITGIAGPDGGTPQKPVGLVHFGCARRGGGVTLRERRYGDAGRAAIRLAAVATALEMLEGAV
jgi:nicotinamide-nucleotide amidase